MVNDQGTPKVLIVDDIKANLVALKMLLKKLDVEVIQAQSGKEAIDLNSKYQIDLILLDVMMPEMDGYQVAEILSNDDKTSDIPIIFVTAMDKSEVNESLGYSKGAIDFIFKPINETVLISKVKVHLELQSKKQVVHSHIDSLEGKKPKILLVDDNEENLIAAASTLSVLNADIVQVTNGNDALSATLYNDFALVILDVYMSGMDGYEVAKILKYDEKTSSLPIIFITAIDRDSIDEIKGYQQGAVDFIVKPYSSFILLSKVKVFLELYKVKSALEHVVESRTIELEKANATLARQNLRLRSIVPSIGRFSNSDAGDSNLGQLILEEFAQHMQAQGGSIYLIKEDGLHLMHALNGSNSKPYLPIPLVEGSVFQHVIDSGQATLVPDINQMGSVMPSGWEGYINSSVLAFPVLDIEGGGSKPIAVLTLHDKKTPPFTAYDLEVGRILTSYIGETFRGSQYKVALVRSQRQYRALFERANDGLFLIDRFTLDILDANLAALDITGLSIGEIKNLTMSDVLAGSSYCFSDNVEQLDHATDIGQVRIKNHDGLEREALMSLVPLDGYCSMCLVKDITEELQIQEKLQRSRELKSLGTMAGGIADDFNSLLVPILGYSEMLLKFDVDDESRKTALQEIHLASSRAQDLVKQILTFSSQGKNNFGPVIIEPIVQDVKSQLQQTLQDNIVITLILPDSSSTINGETTLLHQLVMNLVKNGCQAMEKEGGELTLSLAHLRIDNSSPVASNLIAGEYYKLTVADCGEGMDKALIEKIFDPFFTTKKSEEGTGMGLAVVHGVLQRLGGIIEVESEIDHGSCFTIYLPCCTV
ncbi:MAG: response regulator [Desulfotalea sp.]